MGQALNKESLEQLIKVKQSEMYYVASMHGYTHPCVVACSQDLDQLINQYQGIPNAS